VLEGHLQQKHFWMAEVFEDPSQHGAGLPPCMGLVVDHDRVIAAHTRVGKPSHKLVVGKQAAAGCDRPHIRLNTTT
jgi:hypothetical protein